MSKIPLEPRENELDTLKKMEHQYKVILQEYKRTFNIFMDSLKGKQDLDNYKSSNVKYNNEYYRINKYGYMRKYEDWERRDKTCKSEPIEIDGGEQGLQFQKMINNDIILKGYRRAIGEPCDLEGNNIELKEEIVKQIPVGSSSFYMKTVVLPENDLIVSGKPVNHQNSGWTDQFKTKVQKIPFSKDILFVERTDSKDGWGQNLILEGRKSKKENKEYTINVGKSENNSAIVVLPESGMTVDAIPLQKTNMTFKTNVFNNQLIVTRTDNKFGWTEPIQFKGYKQQKYSKMGYLTQEGELEMYPNDEITIQHAMKNGCPKNTVQLSPGVFNTFTKSSTPLTFESNCSTFKLNSIRTKLDDLQNQLQTLSKKIETYIQTTGKTKPNFNSNIHSLNDKMKTITDLRNQIEYDLKYVGNSNALLEGETQSMNSGNNKLLMLLGFSLLSGGLIFKLTR